MRIRKAKDSDIDQWFLMRAALWPDAEDEHMGELKEYFDGVSIDIELAYVVEIDVELVGFIELNIRNFAEGSRNPKVPYVEGWYIKPDYQGRGVGRALMQQAELWAKEQGYTELASDTEIVNEKSIALHKQLGFKETERIVCFIKNLC